ncbi:MAG TPA: aldehyde ferredoxin oxidoreductase [Syntrophaceae bacterium]|nr:aldehyde ferredoxin oxidoreductase [Syntrophaceae bacterium]
MWHQYHHSPGYLPTPIMEDSSELLRSGRDLTPLLSPGFHQILCISPLRRRADNSMMPPIYEVKQHMRRIAALEEQKGKGAVCASIGPAGEQGVLFANVILGGARPGAAGRAGMGAVMGVKKLKAIVVSGRRRTRIADRQSLLKRIREKSATMKENTKLLTTYGTPFLVNVINAKGMLGTRNNSTEVFAHSQDISGERIKEKYWHKDTACFGCPVACGKNVHVIKGEYAGMTVKMPEYETLYAVGSMLDNRDIDSIINGNHACDLMGIDTISMGVTLSFVAECIEKGIISEKEIGEKVDFADGAAMVSLIKKTARKEGIGALLALGSARLAGKFGKDAYKYLYAVKGLEIAGHSARGLRGMSLSYSTSTRGGSHHDGRPNYAKEDPDPGFTPQPKYIQKSQYFTAVGDSLVLCRFIAERGLGTPLNEEIAKIVGYVTGWDITLAELERIGERIYNLERLINVTRGISRKDDTLPYRVMNEPIPEGPAKGRYCSKADLDALLDTFYALRGWDQNGIPTKEKLTELGLK